jgi:hypothetical protein
LVTVENLLGRRFFGMEIVVNRDEESYVINTPVDIVDEEGNEFSCVVETRITSVGGMHITDREIVWDGDEPEDKEAIEQKILEEVETSLSCRS